MRWLRGAVVLLAVAALAAAGVALFGPSGALRTLPASVTTLPSSASTLPALDASSVLRAFPDPEVTTYTVPAFSSAKARAHASALARIGVRTAGSANERRAADYCRSVLAGWGYETTVQTFPIPGGRTSRNVIATRTGDTTRRIVLGAHIDTHKPSPGANDNASGAGVLLELARMYSGAYHGPTLTFVFFGSEEIAGDSPDEHHFGSREYVRRLSTSQRAAVGAMVSADMVGRGKAFSTRTMARGTRSLERRLRVLGPRIGIPLSFLRDEGPSGWSDHEAFELAGIPAVWLEWRTDPDYHTSRDVPSRLQDRCVRTTGRLLDFWIRTETDASLAALRS